MAKLYITELNNIATDRNGRAAQVAILPSVTTQTVNIGASSAQSAAFSTATNFIRVHTDSVCSIKVDADPTATTSTSRLAADQTEYFQVTPGHKLAVISNT